MSDAIESIIADLSEEVQAIDEALIMDVAGVAQALDQLRSALNKIDESLDQRRFSDASSLGYGVVSSEFIFLQRVLGALQSSQHLKEGLVSKIALKANRSYEAVLPFLDQHLKSSKPKTAQSI